MNSPRDRGMYVSYRRCESYVCRTSVLMRALFFCQIIEIESQNHKRMAMFLLPSLRNESSGAQRNVPHHAIGLKCGDAALNPREGTASKESQDECR